uniref:SSD domain-containing protein n=1 Tax=Rhabditophanes sp. KR3021 TaxID=114890 RepID=A0AC35U8T7_9BILA
MGIEDTKHNCNAKKKPLFIRFLTYSADYCSIYLAKYAIFFIIILDTVLYNFTVYNSIKKSYMKYSEFCKNLCVINEPIRHFYNGLTIERDFANSTETASSHIDLSFPITTVLGRQIHVDPNFFGATIEIVNKNDNTRSLISMDHLQINPEMSAITEESLTSVQNNLKEFKLILLQFRAEMPPGISTENATQWEIDIEQYYHKKFTSDIINVYVLSETFLTSEVVRSGLTLVPFLAIGFVIMCVFSSITMALAAGYVGQYNYHKITLAFFACVCPFMACGTALGFMFWCGFRFGSILCVTPFLVLAIGVDDSYLMVNSWQRYRTKYEEAHKNGKVSKVCAKTIFKDVLIDTAPSITITTLTNILAFGIGALTPTPEIQLFSIGNTLAIIVDYTYTWIFYGTILYYVGKQEIDQLNLNSYTSKEVCNKESESTPKNNIHKTSFSTCKANLNQFLNNCLDWYIKMLTNTTVALSVIVLLAVYWYISLNATFHIKAELKPQKLFLTSSNAVKILDIRNEFVAPFYSFVFVFVNSPGNMSNVNQIARINNLVNDFEDASSVVSKHYTKYWYRDYELFVQSIQETNKEDLEEINEFDLTNENSSRHPVSVYQENSIIELKQFLSWPEFSFWNGFIDYDELNNTIQINRFFFTTATNGYQLRDWSFRSQNLERWRAIADKYNDLNVTVYEDDAKFLDLIPTLIPQTLQSAACTLICMFLVCIAFIGDPTTVLVATFSITSTCIGVFGILALWGEDLDPIVMSAAIMSIGFAVDVPAHITYHYFGTDEGGSKVSVPEKLKHCLLSIGFPVLEAGISTNVCVLSLLYVDLHIATVFVKIMVLVVTIGLIHGLIIIPVLFYLISLIPSFSTESQNDFTIKDIALTKSPNHAI